ncbi:MAG: tyrosine-protein kinase family protein [Myxococcales bacterium]|nr:tyrosine-protein kinase family protein [Myxococcales bacterium]
MSERRRRDRRPSTKDEPAVPVPTPGPPPVSEEAARGAADDLRGDLRGDLKRDPLLDRTALTMVPPTQKMTLQDAQPVIDSLERIGESDDPESGPEMWVERHRMPSRLDRRLVLLREPDSWRSACFRVLRHRLAEHGDPRVIAVTSAERGEGKTTCAVNLALALGECGRARVLLVEANLRAPSLAALFGFTPPACFAVQLERHRRVPLDPWSVVEAYSPSLHVLAVRAEGNPRPLLDGPAFACTIAALRRGGYEYIVLDTPPVLGSADVNLAADSADGVLFTTWARRSSTRALRRAVEQLAPAKILGVTLLDV